MPAPDLALASRHVALDSVLRDAVVLVRDGTIAGVVGPSEVPTGVEVRDLGALALLPGLVDAHVHVNEPGRTEWEGFDSATRAAAAGGITTLVDMPLNCIPVTTSPQALRIKQDAIAGLLRVDCALWGGVVPGNAAALEAMVAGGAVGFKAFLVHSGIDEFPACGESDLRRAMQILAPLGVPLLAHAELAEHLAEPPAGESSTHYAAFLASRPAAAEDAAIALLIRLCRETRCRVHVVHLSSSSALELVAQARADGLPFSAETCPHYLALAAEDVPDGATEYKCAPPIRDRRNQERLWEGLRDGTIDQIVSDHSPCTPHLKSRDTGDFLSAWGGISSVQLTLPVTWTEARSRGFGLPDLARWMCTQPARLAGLARKGRIAAGCDADLIVVDPDAAFVVDAASLHHRHKLTPYAGKSLRGVVRETILRGQTIFRDGAFTGPPLGQLLRGDVAR